MIIIQVREMNITWSVRHHGRTLVGLDEAGPGRDFWVNGNILSSLVRFLPYEDF